MSLHFSRTLVRVAPMLWLAACASGGAEQAAPTTSATSLGTNLAIIEVVHNDPRVSGAVTILVEPEVGVRSTLGTVEPGQTKQFTYNAPAGNYRLVVPGTKTSETFRLSNREIATWDMQTNRVRPRNKT